MTNDVAFETRGWLLQSTAGTLCTLSTAEHLDGFPFGSLVPYALDERGRPLLLIAEIAEHTRNAERDPRASLFISEPGRSGDPQAGWRVNVAGTLTRLRSAGRTPKRSAAREQRVDDGVEARLRARYVERVPAAASYAATHDFFLWRLEPVRVHDRWLWPDPLGRG